MERDKLLGLSKLRKGNWRLALDALGHFGIAFAAALVLLVPATIKRWRLALCVGVGAAVGFGAMLLREGIQLGVSGSLHLYDRLLDLAPAPLAGALAGLLAWWAAGCLRAWWARRRS
jgi:hypothetical protein